jgi:hypothetical protein
MAGYSGAALAKKLSLKDGQRAFRRGMPASVEAVCAVGETWSGLKLVIRRELR